MAVVNTGKISGSLWIFIMIRINVPLPSSRPSSSLLSTGQRNEVGLLKACGSRTAICLKRQAELDRRLRENTCKIMETEEKKLTQLTICELNQLKIESGIEQLKLTKID